jgi:outer membrane immunogenic protein
MKKILIGTVAALAIATTGQALAADLPARVPAYKAPVVVPVAYTWTGCYIGGHAGYAWSRDSYTLNNSAVIENFSFNPTSFIGGGQVGCQYQFTSNLVAGIEGTWSGMNLNQTDPSFLSPPRQRTFKIDQIATVVGKLGFTWDRWMLYGKGGFADARIDTVAFNPATGVTADLNSWQGGVTAGIGLEYMPWQNLVLGIEADWYNFKFDRSGVANDGVPVSFFNTKSDVFAVTGRASWLFNFNAPGPVVTRY